MSYWKLLKAFFMGNDMLEVRYIIFLTLQQFYIKYRIYCNFMLIRNHAINMWIVHYIRT